MLMPYNINIHGANNIDNDIDININITLIFRLIFT